MDDIKYRIDENGRVVRVWEKPERNDEEYKRDFEEIINVLKAEMAKRKSETKLTK